MAREDATVIAVEKWFVDRGTPHLIEAYSATRKETPRLRRRQRGNLYLVVLISQTVQIALVCVTVVAFFTAFGPRAAYLRTLGR